VNKGDVSLKNITIYAELLSLFEDDFTEEEIGVLTKAVLRYAENGTKTDVKDRGLRVFLTLLFKEMDREEILRKGNAERQMRYRKNHKG
jgi:hypothetical protein